jgi:hypothetical protein
VKTVGQRTGASQKVRWCFGAWPSGQLIEEHDKVFREAQAKSSELKHLEVDRYIQTCTRSRLRPLSRVIDKNGVGVGVGVDGLEDIETLSERQSKGIIA